MNPPPNDDDILQLKNPAVTAFRVTLWLAPTVFAVFTFVGWALIKRKTGDPGPVIVSLCFLLNAAFTMGAGWFNAWLSVKARKESGGIRMRTLLFFLYQIFLIPVIGIFALLGFATMRGL